MKNFFFTLVVFFSCIVSAFAFSGGTGTANNPYLIANFSDWHDMINQSTSSAHYRLISDINIEPYIIGENTAQWSFSGFLYGSGHALLLPDSINTNILALVGECFSKDCFYIGLFQQNMTIFLW